MTTAKGYYSLIQYCPDLGRLESANVGVLLFVPECRFIAARTSGGNDRLRRFFGVRGPELDQINAIKSAIQERIERERDQFVSIDDLHRFISTRANEVQITAPRPVKVFDPEQDLQLLFDKLVGGRSARTRSAGVVRTLEETFTREKVEGKLRKNIPVTVPLFGRSYTVPFGYQNGMFNLLQPVSFEGLQNEGVLARASKYAVEGHSLHTAEPGELGQLRLVVVGSFDNERPQDRDRVRSILTQFESKFFPIDDMRGLIDDIRSSTSHQG